MNIFLHTDCLDLFWDYVLILSQYDKVTPYKHSPFTFMIVLSQGLSDAFDMPLPI